jgi:hypothetical protein
MMGDTAVVHIQISVGRRGGDMGSIQLSQNVTAATGSY